MDWDALETLGFYPTSFGLTRRVRGSEKEPGGRASGGADAGGGGDDDDVMVLAGDDDPEDALALGEEEEDAKDDKEDADGASPTTASPRKADAAAAPEEDADADGATRLDSAPEEDVIRGEFELAPLDLERLKAAPLPLVMQGMQILQMRHVKLVQAVAAAPEEEEKAAASRALAELGQARMLELRAAAMEMQEAIDRHRRETLPFGGGIGDRACHNCGERGHFARDCPSANTRSCHTCGQSGHLAKACPMGPVAGDRACHVCGERGHLARECKQATCFGKPGHKQFECPENVCFKAASRGTSRRIA